MDDGKVAFRNDLVAKVLQRVAKLSDFDVQNEFKGIALFHQFPHRS